MKQRCRFLFAAAGAAIAVAVCTSGPAAATAAPAAAPAGYTASFTGTLKGAAQGGTSDGCVITARPVDPNQAAVTPSPALLPRLITVKWDNFTVKRKPVSMQLLVGAPLAATGGPGAYPVPWQSGAPTGAAELTVTDVMDDLRDLGRDVVAQWVLLGWWHARLLPRSAAH